MPCQPRWPRVYKNPGAVPKWFSCPLENLVVAVVVRALRGLEVDAGRLLYMDKPKKEYELGSR